MMLEFNARAARENKQAASDARIAQRVAEASAKELARQLEKMQQQLDTERRRMTCVICWEAERRVAPGCNHLCMCADCAKVTRECPICRKGFKKAKTIYLS